MPSAPPVKRAGPASPDKSGDQGVQPGPARQSGPDHTERLRKVIARIDEHPLTPTSVRSILSGMFRFANPFMSLQDLPKTIHRHPLNPERSSLGGSRFDVVIFYLGNAISGLQHAYAADQELAKTPTTKVDERLKAKALLDEALIILNARLTRLELLAEIGSGKWVQRGNEGTGYFLLTRDEAVEAKRKEAEVAMQVEKAQGEIEDFHAGDQQEQ